ncbi:MAG: metal ABC transporter substrate-binding protein [Angustibacter sp.]
MPFSPSPCRALIATALVGLTTLGTACSAEREPQQDSLSVITSFYPIEFITKRIGQDRVQVANLTQPGAEPHDLELTPSQVATLSRSDVAIYLKGFQPAVDEAISTAKPRTALDVGPNASLDLTYTPIEDGEPQPDEAGIDPHFWLDPARLSTVAEKVAETLSAAAPKDQELFAKNLRGLQADLTNLDREFSAGLASCRDKKVVTSHNAFGYLTRKYTLTQVPISGLTPETEPNPRDLARVTKFVKENSISTIYSETLINPATAKTIAAEAGAKVAVLDPLEGLSASNVNQDYLSIMRANLTTLRTGQSCR